MRYLLFMLLFCVAVSASAQKKLRVGFYNMENLFDTINDPKINDEEFLPSAKNKWNSERYNQKITNLARVISTMNPDVMGCAEVENESVLRNLVSAKALASSKYGIVHYNSPDVRGIDVALIYKKKSVRVISSRIKQIATSSDTSFHTRPVLVVQTLVGKKDTIWYLVNHWPSRRGGTDQSISKRVLAANTLRSVADSIRGLNSNARILMMGDFNDEPADSSIRKVLGASADTNAVYFDMMSVLKARGEGSHYYKGEKSMLDQIIVSQPMLHSKKGYCVKWSDAHILAESWMLGEVYKGDPPAPLRTFAGSRYTGFFSDHLPVYVDLVKR